MPDFRIEHHKELVSTNTLALQYAREGRPEGAVVCADFQTSGRGKPGNTWVSAAGENLLFSVLLRPPVKANEAPILTQLACRAVAAALKNTAGLEATVKKPNDLLIFGRKICGILTESISSSDGKLEAVVVGVGLNVNSSRESLPPNSTSILEETGCEHDREILMHEILKQLSRETEGLYAGSHRRR